MDTEELHVNNELVTASESSSDENILYEQGGVFIHLVSTCAEDDDVMLGGVLKVIEKAGQNCLQWKSYESEVQQRLPDNDLLYMVNAPEDNTHLKPSVADQQITSEMRIPRSTDKSNATTDPEWMVVALSNNPDCSTDMLTEIPKDLSDICDSPDIPTYDFTVPLEDLHFVKKSKKGVGWKYLVLELNDHASLPPLHFHQGGSKKFLKTLKLFLDLTPSPDNPQMIKITNRNQAALSRSISELNVFAEDSFPAKLLQHPVASALAGFSKVTNLLQDVLNPQEMTSETRPAHERASVFDEDCSELTPLDRNALASGDFEVISSAKLTPRVDPARHERMTEEIWNSFKDEEGRITEVDQVKDIIFKGGLTSDIRKEVWKYLLQYYHWKMTEKELREYRRKMEEDYYRIKMQWKSIDEDQERRFSALRDQKSLIEKDVTRTDRTREFYEGNENISLKLLNDILVTYVMYNFDLGYVQGMSDLLSPILEVMKNEVDAFWCFVGFMDIVEHNFDKNQCGMKKQLHDLRTLLQFIDCQLFDNLSEKDSNNLYFCFRWLLLRFKREFSFEDIQTMWEVMWTGLPCRNYHLLICVAILDTERSVLLGGECGFSDILKHINELSGSINLEATLSKAEGMYNQIKSSRDIPDAVRDVLSIPIK